MQNIEERNALAVENLGIAKRSAHDMHRRLVGKIDFDTLLSGAMLGLLDAASRYDPSRGTTFTTMAKQRCSGAMLDDLREASHRTRPMADASRQIADADSRFYAEHGRHPTRDELRETMGVSERRMPAIEASAAAGHVGQNALTERRGRRFRGEPEEVEYPAPNTGDPVARADWWLEMCRGLTRTEKAIVLMHFRDGLTMRETGRALDLSESRISQLTIALMARMKQSPRVKRLAECVHAP